MKPLAVVASGMVTAVGLSAPAACAAIRCAIDNFTETRFIDEGGKWIRGAQIPLDEPWRGFEKLVRMAVPAINECLAHRPDVPASAIPLFLCVAEPERAGRFQDVGTPLLRRIEQELGRRFHASSSIIPAGRVGGAIALATARELIHDQGAPLCLIVGVDSFLATATLGAYQSKARLLTSKNPNGFIPGEAGAAVLVGTPVNDGRPELLCLGIGAGQEPAPIESTEPFRADGMVAAFNAAMAEANLTLADVDYRLTDLNGEQYGFKEAALAMQRTLRDRKELFEIWHPADCIGETGAAVGPVVFGVALAAARKGYAPGAGVICHFAADDPRRFAVILRYGGLKGGAD